MNGALRRQLGLVVAFFAILAHQVVGMRPMGGFLRHQGDADLPRPLVVVNLGEGGKRRKELDTGQASGSGGDLLPRGREGWVSQGRIRKMAAQQSEHVRMKPFRPAGEAGRMPREFPHQPCSQ